MPTSKLAVSDEYEESFEKRDSPPTEKSRKEKDIKTTNTKKSIIKKKKK